jgi:hypothetical protein
VSATGTGAAIGNAVGVSPAIAPNPGLIDFGSPSGNGVGVGGTGTAGAGAGAAPGVGGSASADAAQQAGECGRALQAGQSCSPQAFFRLQAIYFNAQHYRSTADCLSAAHLNRLPLEVCAGR